MVADGGEDVAEFAVLRGGVADAVGGEQRKMQRSGDVEGGAVAGFLFAMEMALQFDIDIVGAEDVRQVDRPGDGLRRCRLAAKPLRVAPLRRR